MSPASSFSIQKTLFSFLLVAVAIFGTFQQAASAQVAGNKIDFAKDVKPILETHCLRCHGPEDEDNGFRVDDSEALSDYIDAGDAEFSDLMGMITGESDDYDQMPPLDDGGPLDDKDVQTIRLWINQGANWPENVKLVVPTNEQKKQLVKEIKEKQAEKDAEDSPWQLLYEIAGLLHPVLLHFPVALLIGGAIFALFGFRGESPMSDAAYYCLWLAALTGILACVSGWSFAEHKSYPAWNNPFDFEKSIDVHRWGGILVSVLAFLLALVASGSRRRDPYGTGAFWKLSLMLLAVLTGYVAHHGGKLTHKGLHDQLNTKTQTLYERLSGDDKPAIEGDEDKQDAKEADKEGNAKVSDEDAKDQKGDADKKSEDEKSDDKSDGQPANVNED